ncbi:hypothetical protein QCA50_004112 [Cerrena zonata]|uniref:Transmembrane protein n=1 Tax=Cerrena zonata TaxID=2478898 RepID=A0AAW0GR84_9APHY
MTSLQALESTCEVEPDIPASLELFVLRCQPHCFFWTVASNVQIRALYSSCNLQPNSHLSSAPPYQQTIQVSRCIVVRDSPHALYLKYILNMHPFILVPLLASFAAMYPVGASPLVYSAPVPVPVVGNTNVGLVSGVLPDMPLPFRRDLGDMKGPMPHDVTSWTLPRQETNEPLVDHLQKHKAGQTSSDTGALSGLPAGVPSSTLPLGATSPGGNSSPLGSTTSLLSALPLGQAGGATGTTSGATSDVPESPATPFTEEAQDEPA